MLFFLCKNCKYKICNNNFSLKKLIVIVNVSYLLIDNSKLEQHVCLKNWKAAKCEHMKMVMNSYLHLLLKLCQTFELASMLLYQSSVPNRYTGNTWKSQIMMKPHPNLKLIPLMSSMTLFKFKEPKSWRKSWRNLESF